MTIIGIMIDLLVFGLMALKDGASMANGIVIMISLLVFGLVVLNHGANMVNVIVTITFQLLSFLMGEWNIGLMGRGLNEYI
jgi:hypothetical protein